MYICTYVYYVILLYLEGSGSKFHSVNTKTSKFSLFLDSKSWEKTYIYICVCVYLNYFQQFPRILWVAQLPMGFHLAPKTPVDAGNAMFSHQTFVLCSISAPDFCKTRDMYIYIYACLFKRFSKKTLFSGAPLHFHILPSILVYANDSSFYISKCTLHIHIYMHTHILYNSKQFPKNIIPSP